MALYLAVQMGTVVWRRPDETRPYRTISRPYPSVLPSSLLLGSIDPCILGSGEARVPEVTSHLEGGEEAAKAAGVEEVSHRVVELLRRRSGGRPPGADRLLTAPHVGEAPAHRSIPPLPRLAPSLPSLPRTSSPNPPFVSGREANRRRSRFIFRKRKTAWTYASISLFGDSK
ncbi:hypothetical protein GW17_00008089 [Ensete ventricosum]|nr:hypothetical protein GW17_00008089 [Ensete ventricosum]